MKIYQNSVCANWWRRKTLEGQKSSRRELKPPMQIRSRLQQDSDQRQKKLYNVPRLIREL